jgi:hypothetical protein
MPIYADGNFSDQLAYLLADAEALAAATLNDDTRVWMLPSGFTGNPLDPTAFVLCYSREDLSSQYQDVLINGGSVGDEMACRVQADYLSTQERAIRLRYSSSVRNKIHAAARRAGHSYTNGPVGNVFFYAQNLVASGSR